MSPPQHRPNSILKGEDCSPFFCATSRKLTIPFSSYTSLLSGEYKYIQIHNGEMCTFFLSLTVVTSSPLHPCSLEEVKNKGVLGRE